MHCEFLMLYIILSMHWQISSIRYTIRVYETKKWYNGIPAIENWNRRHLTLVNLHVTSRWSCVEWDMSWLANDWLMMICHDWLMMIPASADGVENVRPLWRTREGMVNNPFYTSFCSLPHHPCRLHELILSAFSKYQDILPWCNLSVHFPWLKSTTFKKNMCNTNTQESSMEFLGRDVKIIQIIQGWHLRNLTFTISKTSLVVHYECCCARKSLLIWAGILV